MNTLKDHYKQKMKKNGHECTINYQVKSKCFFREIKDMKGYQDMKYMFTDVNQCKQGDIIECIHKRYVVIQLDQSYNNVYDRYIIRELTHVVKVKDDLNLPVFFQDVILKMNETTIEFDTTKMIMYAPYTNTQLVNYRFIFKGQAWKIKSQNRLFLQGLVIYNMESDLLKEGEDKLGFEELEPTKPEDGGTKPPDPNPTEIIDLEGDFRIGKLTAIKVTNNGELNTKEIKVITLEGEGKFRFEGIEPSRIKVYTTKDSKLIDTIVKLKVELVENNKVFVEKEFKIKMMYG